MSTSQSGADLGIFMVKNYTFRVLSVSCDPQPLSHRQSMVMLLRDNLVALRQT